MHVIGAAQFICAFVALLYGFFGVTCLIAPHFLWGPDSVLSYWEEMDESGTWFCRMMANAMRLQARNHPAMPVQQLIAAASAWAHVCIAAGSAGTHTERTVAMIPYFTMVVLCVPHGLGAQAPSVE